MPATDHRPLRQRATTKAGDHIRQGVRGVGWVDEIGIEHQVIDRTRQFKACDMVP